MVSSQEISRFPNQLSRLPWIEALKLTEQSDHRVGPRPPSDIRSDRVAIASRRDSHRIFRDRPEAQLSPQRTKIVTAQGMDRDAEILHAPDSEHRERASG